MFVFPLTILSDSLSVEILTSTRAFIPPTNNSSPTEYLLLLTDGCHRDNAVTMDLLYWLKPTASTGVYIVHQPKGHKPLSVEFILSSLWWTASKDARFVSCHSKVGLHQVAEMIAPGFEILVLIETGAGW